MIVGLVPDQIPTPVVGRGRNRVLSIVVMSPGDTGHWGDQARYQHRIRLLSLMLTKN